MKRQKEIITTIFQGSSGFWYIRKDGVVIAGFVNKEHAEMFDNYLKNESNP
jgi:hypothetical protein